MTGNAPGRAGWGIILLPRASGGRPSKASPSAPISGISGPPFTCLPHLGRNRRRGYGKTLRNPGCRCNVSETDALRNGGSRFCMEERRSGAGVGMNDRPHGTGRRDISLYPVPCGRLFSNEGESNGFGIGLRWLGGGIAALPGHLCESPQSTRALAVPVTEGLPESVSPVRRTMLWLPPEAPSLPERFSCCPPPSRSGVRQGWRGTPRRPWRGPFRRG